MFYTLKLHFSPEIPSHEFLETQDNKDVSSGDIEEHPFLDSNEFVDVTGTSDPDVSIEIKAHPLLTESGEHSKSGLTKS